MADIGFEAAVAVAVQSAIGTPNEPAAWDAGTLDETDGAVLGDRDQGDGESGITFPTHTRVGREAARLSRTAAPDTFLREEIDGFAIAYSRKGNGATATPAAGEALPLAGIDALNRGLGLSGANGTAPTYVYTPAATPEYLTIALWIGSKRWYFQDCLVSQRQVTYTPADVGLVVDTIAIGSIFEYAEGGSFPTVTYGTQSSLSAPVIAGVGNTFNALVRGFESLTLTIEGNQDTAEDSNTVSGTRPIVGGIDISAEIRAYQDSSNPDQLYALLTSTDFATDAIPWFFQVGTAAGASDTINAYEERFPTMQAEESKADRTGSVEVEVVTARARAETAGAEYQLTYN